MLQCDKCMWDKNEKLPFCEQLRDSGVTSCDRFFDRAEFDDMEGFAPNCSRCKRDLKPTEKKCWWCGLVRQTCSTDSKT